MEAYDTSDFDYEGVGFGPPSPWYRRWPSQPILLAVMIAVILQVVLLPCKGQEQNIRLTAAFALDGLFLARLAWAKSRDERTWVWLGYLTLLLTSAVWIPHMIEFLRNGHRFV